MVLQLEVKLHVACIYIGITTFHVTRNLHKERQPAYYNNCSSPLGVILLTLGVILLNTTSCFKLELS